VDLTSITNVVAIVLYAVVFGYLMLRTKNLSPLNTTLITSLISAALATHAIGAYGAIVVSDGFRIGIFVIPTLFFWVINLLILVSGLRKPLHNLFLFSLPLTIVAIISSLIADSATVQIESGLAGHIILSMVAYS